jgi:PAS domain S-box-containing protein
LSSYGFDASVVEDLRQLTEQVGKSGRDAILLEISGTTFDEKLLIETLRAAADLPVVVFALDEDPAVALRSIRLGAVDYIAKGSASSYSLEHRLEYAVERRSVGRRRRSNEAGIMLVLEESYDAFIATDSQLRIIKWNDMAERTFGWPREEAFGQTLGCIIPQHLRKQFLTEINDHFKNETSTFLKLSKPALAEHRTGRMFPIELGIFRINAEPSRMYCAFVRDVTKQKQSEEELERLVQERTDELRLSNDQLLQFARIASHDLQEPLRAVQGFVDLLAKSMSDKFDAESREFIDFILDGTHRMKQLIDSILKHSEISAAGSINQVTSCNSVIDEVLADLHQIIQETSTSFTIGQLPEVAVERSQLVQLFQNLIGNCIKYRGDGPPSIAIGAERNLHHWLFSVSDNGIGIDQKYAGKIFDMFYRLHSKGQYPGTGIGLAICKKIVTSHGGNIWVESEAGKGSEFLFTLPVIAEEQGRDKNRIEEIDMKDKIEILLVEDTPSDVRLTQEALRHSGLNYSLFVVADGVEAIEYLNKLKTSQDQTLPDIILLDLNMPRMNGHEVLEEIQNDHELRMIPIVLLTVSERQEDVMQALKLKMNYYLPKPVTAERLSVLVKALNGLFTGETDDLSHSIEETHIRLVLAGNPHTGAAALARLADDSHERVRCRVAENSRLPEELQMKLAKDPQTEVRICLCENQNLSPAVLELLANDGNEDVRLAAVGSPKVTAPILRSLERDSNVFVSASASKALADRQA